jgi:hypothetical protein
MWRLAAFSSSGVRRGGRPIVQRTNLNGNPHGDSIDSVGVAQRTDFIPTTVMKYLSFRHF